MVVLRVIFFIILQQYDFMIGQYSYIGDDGKTYTVKYEAGVNGFRILDGAHVPSGGQHSGNYKYIKFNRSL